MSKHRKAPQSPGGFKKFVRTPKGFVMVTLIVLMLIGAVHLSDAKGILHAFVAVATALVIDTIVMYLQRRPKKLFPDGGVITGLIIALVLSTAVSLKIVVITTAIAVLSKHILKSGRKPFFNPAAFGLLVAIYAFHVGESWWGDLSALPSWCMGFLIIAGFMIASRVNKFPEVFAFVATYLILFLGIGYLFHTSMAADAFRNPILNSALFLAIFMMTDPPTSPAKYSQQVGFGVLTAIISSVLYLTIGGLAYLLIGLLVANVWKAFVTRKSKVQQQKNVQSRPAYSKSI